MKSVVISFKSEEPEQDTDRCDRMHYHAAFAGGENSKVDRAYNICFESEGGERIYLCSVSCRICIRCLATNNKHPNGL